MSQIHVGRPAAFMHNLTVMSNITVCLDSGKLATEACLQDVRTSTMGLLRTENVYTNREDIPGAVCDKHVLVDYCIDGNAGANEYCKKFAEVDQAVVQPRALVKTTQAEINEIAQAMYNGLDYPYWDEHYIYLVTELGNDGNFKGLSGYANKNVVAPYVVCTKHTKDAWEAYEKEHQKDETQENQGNQGDQQDQTGNG